MKGEARAVDEGPDYDDSPFEGMDVRLANLPHRLLV